MTAYSRAGFNWSVNEILSLQREFELLGWNIYQIADKHKRSPHAIIHRLDQEGFADYNVLYSSYYDLNSTNTISPDRKSSPLSPLNLGSLSCEENIDDDEEYFCEEEQEDSDDEDYEYEEDEDDDDDEEDEEDEDEEDEDEEDEDEEYQDEEYQDEEYQDEDDEDKIANLSQRVDGLEEGIFEIKDMIKKMMGSFLTQNSSCIGSCN